MRNKMLRMIGVGVVSIALGYLAVPEAKALDVIKAQSDFALSYQQEAAGNLIGAIKTILGTVAREPKYYEAILRLGYLYGVAGATLDAEETYQKAISLREEAIEPRLGLMQVLTAKGKWDDVIKVGLSVLKMDPHQYTALSRIAWAAYSKGDFMEAQKRYKQILALYPADLEMRLGWGWAVLKSGNKKEAEQIFAEILIISPGNPRGVEGWTQARKN